MCKKDFWFSARDLVVVMSFLLNVWYHQKKEKRIKKKKRKKNKKKKGFIPFIS